MPRILSDDLNKLLIQDNLSGSEIEFPYRMPTTKERIGYANEMVQRKNGKIVNNASATRIKYGLKILEGIRDGDFQAKKDGKVVPMSSNPESGHYFEDWKHIVKQYAADLIELLAIRVFDAPCQTMAADDDGGDGGDAEVDPTP